MSNVDFAVLFLSCLFSEVFVCVMSSEYLCVRQMFYKCKANVLQV